MKIIINVLFALIGFGAIILEFFVPSAGVIGLIGLGLVITGIVLTFSYYGLFFGTIFLISALIIGPLLFIIYFKLFPNSFIGKRLILSKKMTQLEGYTAQKIVNIPEIGSKGVTISNLRPIGEARIKNRKYNVITSGEYIEKGSLIIVKKIEGAKVVVALEELI